MNAPDDEELLLHFYREHPAGERIERALDADPELRARFDRLVRDLGALSSLEPPSPPDGLELRVWNRLRPGLLAPPRRRFLDLAWPAPRYLAAAAAAVLLVAVGFLAGRLGRPAPEPAPQALAAGGPLTAQARDRVLAAALAGHLDASERLLVEVANDGAPAIDDERRFAETLLASNRLYRRAAERAGHRRAAALLAELEPLLVELANSTGDGGDGLAIARQRLESEDLLFKVRVIRSNARNNTRSDTRSNARSDI